LQPLGLKAHRPIVLGVLLPVGLSIDVAATAARAPEPKLADDYVIRESRRIHEGTVPAVRPVAGHVKPRHAVLPHVAQCHRLVFDLPRHPHIVLPLAMVRKPNPRPRTDSDFLESRAILLP
jgi:hypothetical protein